MQRVIVEARARTAGARLGSLNAARAVGGEVLGRGDGGRHGGRGCYGSGSRSRCGPWGDVASLLVPAAVIGLVGFAAPASVARTLAPRDRRSLDPDCEFVSQGAANVVAGLTGGFSVGGSFSRSALARTAGGRTRWSGAVTGLAVLALLPFAGTVSSNPAAVLASVVIVPVAPRIRLRPILELWPASRPQFAVAAATSALTLALAPHVELGVLAGVALAVAVHLWRELRLDIDVAARRGMVHLYPNGVIWFGTAPGSRTASCACSPPARTPARSSSTSTVDGHS